jgi:Putative zinc-finger
MTSQIETMTHEHAVNTMASERYLLEEMSELERHAFEEHFFSCADCAEDLRTAELMRAAARHEGRSEPIPFKPRAVRRWSVAVPWAAAASLALVVGYQAISRPPLDVPYALEPVTLRPTSRGADVVQLGPDSRSVALAVEANAPAGATEWVYELREADASPVANGRLPVPAPGTPLLLVIPASTLKAPGRYVLSLHEREGAPSAVEYRFDVARRAQP